MRSRITVLAVVALSVGVSACGGDSGSATTTLAPMESSVFKTIPTTSTTLSPASAVAPGAEGGALGGETIYEIQPGDYWTGIAQKFGCANYLEVIAYNDNKEAIFPGDQIKIPASCGQTPEATATDTGTTTTAPAAETPETLADDGSASYTIQAGDTLSGIATKFNSSMNAIISLNGWSDGIDHVLIPGRDIKVPVAG